MEVGILEGIGNDAHLEGILRGAAYSQADTINGYTTLVDSKIAVRDHLAVTFVFKSELETTLLILYSQTSGSLVYMALHDMAVKASVHLHTTLYIYLVTYLQKTQIATLQGLAHSGNHIGIILDAYHRQADSVMSHTLVNTQLSSKGAAEGEMYIILVVLDINHTCHCFNYS